VKKKNKAAAAGKEKIFTPGMKKALIVLLCIYFVVVAVIIGYSIWEKPPEVVTPPAATATPAPQATDAPDDLPEVTEEPTFMVKVPVINISGDFQLDGNVRVVGKNGADIYWTGDENTAYYLAKLDALAAAFSALPDEKA